MIQCQYVHLLHIVSSARESAYLKFIHDIIHIRLQFRSGDNPAIRLAGPDSQHGRHVHVLAPPHEFVKTQSIGIRIEPVTYASQHLVLFRESMMKYYLVAPAGRLRVQWCYSKPIAEGC